MMFFAYAMLGAVVFMILDAPAVKPMSGIKSVAFLIAFYIVLCTVYISGASMWPQYDPEDEKGKIDKILKPKRAATEQGKAEELIARAKALDEQAKPWRFGSRRSAETRPRRIRRLVEPVHLRQRQAQRPETS